MGQEHRESLWSVDARFRLLYFVLFDFCLILGVIHILWIRGVETVEEFLESVVTLGIASAILSLGAVEIVGFTMVVSAWLLKKVEEKAAKQREDMRREGATLYKAALDDWREKRDRAKKNGSGFDEPPPTPDSISYK